MKTADLARPSSLQEMAAVPTIQVLDTVSVNSSTSSDTTISRNDPATTQQEKYKFIPIGWVKRGFRSSLEKWLLLTTVLAFLMAAVLGVVPVFEGKLEDTVFAVLIAINAGCVIFYSVNGVFTEEPVQLVTLVASSLVSCVLHAVNYLKDSGETAILDLVVMVVFTALTVLTTPWWLGLAAKYWDERQIIFRKMTATDNEQVMCRKLLMTQSLLVFDLQCTAIILAVVLPQKFTGASHAEISLLIFGVLDAVWLLVSYISMRFEIKYSTWFTLATSIAQPGYVIWITVEAIIGANKDSNLIGSVVALYFAVLIGFTVRFSLILSMWSVLRNYAKGVAEKVYNREPAQSKKKNTKRQSTGPIVATGPNLSEHYSGFYDSVTSNA